MPLWVTVTVYSKSWQSLDEIWDVVHSFDVPIFDVLFYLFPLKTLGNMLLVVALRRAPMWHLDFRSTFAWLKMKSLTKRGSPASKCLFSSSKRCCKTTTNIPSELCCSVGCETGTIKHLTWLTWGRLPSWSGMLISWKCDASKAIWEVAKHRAIISCSVGAGRPLNS